MFIKVILNKKIFIIPWYNVFSYSFIWVLLLSTLLDSINPDKHISCLCGYPIDVNTTKQIRPKYFIATHMTQFNKSKAIYKHATNDKNLNSKSVFGQSNTKLKIWPAYPPLPVLLETALELSLPEVGPKYGIFLCTFLLN